LGPIGRQDVITNDAFRRRWNAAIHESLQWVANARLERAGGSVFHRLATALRAGDLLHHPGSDPADAHAFYRLHFDRPFEIFVVEHDWATAFDGALETGALGDGGDGYRLPYPECCFEFVIAGKRVCVALREAEDPQYRHIVTAALETTQGWMFLPLNENQYAAVRHLLAAQVRAICIALETEIAGSEIVRAPPRLNRARERRGNLPLFDYHVVNLARRRRPPAGSGATDDRDRRRVRLHFRRGHWRHLEDRRIWINWMLVGDPDLGFIDKHYRL
jgi:hypothetical protein